MLRENPINIYETSFRENYALPALTDYFKQENFTYLEMGAEIAKLHLLFDEAGIRQGDRIALIGRNNPRWCITYIATITYGAVIVPILQDFHANDVIHIINHSESRLLFLGDTFWDAIEADQIRKVEAVFSLTDLERDLRAPGSEETDGFPEEPRKSLPQSLSERVRTGAYPLSQDSQRPDDPAQLHLGNDRIFERRHALGQ